MRRLALLACFVACSKGTPELLDKRDPIAKPARSTELAPDVTKLLDTAESVENEEVDSALTDLLAKCERRTLPTSAAPRLIADYERAAKWLHEHQGKSVGPWELEINYRAHREYAAYLLDIFKCLPTTAVQNDVADALTFTDPKLVLFAIKALIALELDVPDDALARVAAAPEVRHWLYRTLDEAGKRARFPRQYLTKQSFAEADMIEWLTYPTELGTFPTDIQFTTVVSDKSGDFYVFEFKASAHEKDGWLAGVAGPYDPKEPPGAEAASGIFSQFAKYDSKSPEQHVAAILKQMQEQ